MKKFRVYGFTNINNPVLITNSENLSFAATFDENMVLQEYMKSTLSFKITDKLESGDINPFMGLIYPGAKIRLSLWENKKFTTYDFIIKSVSSEFYKNVIIYSVQAEDYASVVYSKEGQGLSIDRTGTLRELIEEVLVKTRKNLGYRNLNNNYISLNNYTSKNNLTVNANSIKSSYVGYSDITIPRDKNIQSSPSYYNFSFNVLSKTSDTNTVSLQQLQNSTILATNTITITNGLNIIENLFINTNTNKFKIIVNSNTVGVISISDFKLQLDIGPRLDTIKQYLHIAGDSSTDTTKLNEEHFKSEVFDSISYYKKITLTLSNSNLYNALIEIAKLFNAEIAFNYEESTINFKNKVLEYSYKGYRLSPNFNLLTLSRDENFEEFNSVLMVNSNEYVNSIIPNVPSEFKQYLFDCINNNFTGTNYFETYGDNTKLVYNYLTAATYVKDNYVSNAENQAERYAIIDAFASAADKVPNLENTIYSLDYFKNNQKISYNDYDLFNKTINDDLRKINIKLKLYSEVYYNISSTLLSRDSQIDFISRNLVVERIRLAEINAVLASATSGDIKTSYESQKRICIDTIADYTRQLIESYNITYTYNTAATDPSNYYTLNTTSYTSDKYVYMVLNYGGYSSTSVNGIVDKINNINTIITDLTNTKTEKIARRDLLVSTLIPAASAYRKTELEVELAGLNAEIDNYVYTLGDGSINGMYYYQLLYLNFILSKLSTLSIPLFDGLYNLLYNEYYDNNITVQKQILLNNLYSNYERFIIEGYYENADETTSEGLLEQALLSFELTKFPKINFGVSIIDISALQDYDFIDLIIGDKILIQENEDRLYKSYVNIIEQILDINPPVFINYGSEKYLEVSEINYNLREPGNTSLVVAQEDQTTRILQKLILNIAGL